VYVCQWHLEVPFGKQADAMRVIRAWGVDKFTHSRFRLAKSARVLVGHIGASASHLVDEYLFETLADFESALADMGDERFRAHAAALAPFVVPGSQQWAVWRVIE
jgi:hypothetical protein